MFERFTDRARRVAVLAQEEARTLSHDYIGTEHILLGLIHEHEGVAAMALERLGVSLEAVRAQVEEFIGQGQVAPSGHIPFTPRAKKVFELSLREALQLGHAYIGTEHILLGLIREGQGIAAQVLQQEVGDDLKRVRQEVMQLLSDPQAKASTEKLEKLEKLPIRLTHRQGERPTLLLGGVDITRFVSDRGLLIDYDVEDSVQAGPEVTLKFARGRLELDFDVELLERLLVDARTKVGA